MGHELSDKKPFITIDSGFFEEGFISKDNTIVISDDGDVKNKIIDLIKENGRMKEVLMAIAVADIRDDPESMINTHKVAVEKIKSLAQSALERGGK